ncbi:hypothetical protein E2C01_085258 [Portunus trituberculatus]|uniref:Uncharacterized protein n=1 Tax=Portunus trituberculatus TaxID=210409 RepID=A0A5B7IXD2_PORTR|nr:hypothetical protein [Portunus trituberculatus]
MSGQEHYTRVGHGVGCSSVYPTRSPSPAPWHFASLPDNSVISAVMISEDVGSGQRTSSAAHTHTLDTFYTSPSITVTHTAAIQSYRVSHRAPHTPHSAHTQHLALALRDAFLRASGVGRCGGGVAGRSGLAFFPIRAEDSSLAVAVIPSKVVGRRVGPWRGVKTEAAYHRVASGGRDENYQAAAAAAAAAVVVVVMVVVVVVVW